MGTFMGTDLGTAEKELEFSLTLYYNKTTREFIKILYFL